MFYIHITIFSPRLKFSSASVSTKSLAPKSAQRHQIQPDEVLLYITHSENITHSALIRNRRITSALVEKMQPHVYDPFANTKE